MASGTTEWTPSGGVSTGLIPFLRRANWIATIRTVLVGALIVLATLCAAMWLDLIWAIPTAGRWAITRVGIVVAVALVVASCYSRWRRRTLGDIAVNIDSRAHTGGQMLAGWQLESSPPQTGSSLTHGFAHVASRRASERLARITPESVLPDDPAKRAAWMLCGGLVVAALLAMVMPGVAWNQWQRFAFPARDVPPYTGVVIELKPEDATVRYGDEVTIQASVTAGRADVMQLVTLTPDGKERALPMLSGWPDEWQTVLTRVTDSIDFYARSGRSRSRVGKLQVQTTPEIIATQIRLKPLEYTRLATYEGPIPKDGIKGLAGTEVSYTVKSNRPLHQGSLQLEFRDGTTEHVTLAPLANQTEADETVGVVQGTITLGKAGRFKITVTDVDGVESVDYVEGAITITTDQRPVVRILEPKPLSLATPDVRLAVVVAAEDDFGLANLQLFRSLNGSIATPMAFDIDGGPRQNVMMELPLDQYGLQAGDEIQLFARIEDNDPAGAKGAESPVTTVRIISTQQFQEMLLQQQGAESIAAKYQAAQRYLENVAEALREVEKAAEAAAASPDSQEAAERLQEKLEAARQAANEAAKSMETLAKQPMPIDVDRELARRLAEMAGKASQAADQLGTMAQSQAGKRPLSDEEKQQLQEMAEQLGQQRDQLQKQAIDPLQKLQQAMPLLMDQQRFVELATRQRDLATRLDSLRSASEPNDPKAQRRIAELEAEQQQLRDALSNLLDDIDAHRAALGDEPEFEQLKATAQKFTEAVRSSEAQARMAGAQQNLLQSDFTGATAQAKSAAEILESFLSQCNGMGQSACKSCEMAFNPSAGCPNLGNSLQQMLAMMGMKPGTSSGGMPGAGFGFGAGGGYSVRTPGPQNIGMYGSLPMTQPRASRGRSDQQSRGMATNSSAAPQRSGSADDAEPSEGSAAGQGESSVPAQYRSQVAEYFRLLTEELGEEP